MTLIKAPLSDKDMEICEFLQLVQWFGALIHINRASLSAFPCSSLVDELLKTGDGLQRELLEKADWDQRTLRDALSVTEQVMGITSSDAETAVDWETIADACRRKQ